MAKSTGVTAKSETLTEYLKRKAAESNDEFDLPSGLKCRMSYFNGAKALKMGEIVGESKDRELTLGAIINLTCEFSHDGVTWARIIPEDAKELIQGFDYTTLLGKLQGIPLDEGK
jgi:hypothetical protein